MSELARCLAGSEGSGYVVAPAGYGKTYLIAEAVKAGFGTQLVLTHTFAGVSALRAKMTSLDVPTSAYWVDTIASWCLRICVAYPKTADWNIEHPENADWMALYKATKPLLKEPFIQRIIRASYSGVYVDEYQDCSISQHEVVVSLANILPCRILGDPMQGIFDFNDAPVDWEQHVYSEFENLGELGIPYRWKKAGADELGEWLKDARKRLKTRTPIDLSGRLPRGLSVSNCDISDYNNRSRFDVFYQHLGTPDSAAAIFQGAMKWKAHKLANQLGGKFSSIEEVEGIDLMKFVSDIDSADLPREKLLRAIKFGKATMMGGEAPLASGTRRGEAVSIRSNTKNRPLTRAANTYLENPSSANLRMFLRKWMECPNVCSYRTDLFNRSLAVLCMDSEAPCQTLRESAQVYQKQFRHRGRLTAHNKLIGTTLLVKGLEFDHAIVVDASSLSKKELYVALTRGAKTLTILSREARLC